MHPYDQRTRPHLKTLNEMVSMIEDPGQRAACKRFMAEMEDRVCTSFGSRSAHHAWEGGYLDHIVDVMNIGKKLFELMRSMGPLDFTLSDVLVVLFWHDVEKPFRYIEPRHPLACGNKAQRAQFREQIFERFGLLLTAQQQNAMDHVEGEINGTYIPGGRAMNELAAVCHAADTLSARGRHSPETMGTTIANPA